MSPKRLNFNNILASSVSLSNSLHIRREAIAKPYLSFLLAYSGLFYHFVKTIFFLLLENLEKGEMNSLDATEALSSFGDKHVR